MKPQTKPRWRLRAPSPPQPAMAAEPHPEPELRPRRPEAPPPATIAGWPAAWLSLGAAGAALIGFAVLTFLS